MSGIMTSSSRQVVGGRVFFFAAWPVSSVFHLTSAGSTRSHNLPERLELEEQPALGTADSRSGRTSFVFHFLIVSAQGLLLLMAFSTVLQAQSSPAIVHTYSQTC